MNDNANITLSVKVEDLETRGRVIGLINATVANLIGYDVEFSFSSYKADEEEIDPEKLADWEKDLLDSGHDHDKCEAALKEPGFQFRTEPAMNDRMGVARHLVADMVNDVETTSFADEDFQVVGFSITDDGWKAFLFLPARPSWIYTVTRYSQEDESTVEFFNRQHICTIVGG
jgi:hypothetical protein